MKTLNRLVKSRPDKSIQPSQWKMVNSHMKTNEKNKKELIMKRE